MARGKKNAAKPGAFTLDLKTRDGGVTGSVSIDTAKKARPQSIQDVKVDGDTIRFTTRVVNKKSDTTFLWSATVDGDKITGTRSRDGAKGTQQFTGKRTR